MQQKELWVGGAFVSKSKAEPYIKALLFYNIKLKSDVKIWQNFSYRI